MKRVTIDQISSHVGGHVLLSGWLYNLRRNGQICFPQLRDGTGILQCFARRDDMSSGEYDRLYDLTQESSLIVEGKVRAEGRAPGGYEIDVQSIEVIQRVSEEEPYPITPKEHGIEFLMDKRHLWLRSRRQGAVMRVRAEVKAAICEFLDGEGFLAVDAPIFMSAACEHTTTAFGLGYFEDETVYLTQSGQLYNEATAMAFGKVYSFGPIFRAEKYKTRRHLTEFWMVEPEMAYATLDDAKRVAEELICFVVGRVLKNRCSDLAVLGRDISRLEVVQPPFPRISYDQAVRMLKDQDSDIEWGSDFGGTDETVLGDSFDRPVVVEGFPAKFGSFYCMPAPEDPTIALDMNIIAPEGFGELVSGGQRIHDPELLRLRMDSRGLPEEAFQWYADLRKYGTVPHSGFGMGIERLVAWICGTEHVREVIPFPRMLYRTTP